MEVKKYEKIILDSSRSIDDIVASVKAELSKQESKNAGESYICYVSHAYSSGENAGANYIVVSDGFKELKRLSSNVIQISPYNKDEINELIATNINTKANANSVVTLTGEQTIEGVKTFSSVPVVTTQPTNDNQVANKAYVDSKSSQLNSRIDGVNNSLTNSINAKANSNAVVNLSGNQTINGIKTFTSNITAPNITTLQNQMGGLISSNVYPILTKNTSLDITAGRNGDFTNLIDALIFLKQNISKNPNIIGKITLLSSFNDDLYLKGYPFKIFIDCNGFQLANNLFLEKCNIKFSFLRLQGQLNCLISTVYVVNGADIRGNSKLSGFFGSSIVANGNSFVSISGSTVLRPPATEAGIYSKASRVYLVNPSEWTQIEGQYFAYVIAGGIICADNGANLKNVIPTKANVAVNTLTPYGIIFGNIWG